MMRPPIHTRSIRMLALIWTMLLIFAGHSPAGAATQEVAVVDGRNRRPDSERQRPPKPATTQVIETCKGKDCPPPMARGGACANVGHSLLTPTIVLLDKTSYQIGETISYTVRLENSGHVSYSIPLRTSIREIEPENSHADYSYSEGGLVFELRAQDAMYFTSGGLQLWGSREKPGSMIDLRPGEWVELRGETSIRDWRRVLDSSGNVREEAVPPGTRIEVALCATFISGGAEYFFNASTQEESRVCHASGTSVTGTVKLTIVKLPVSNQN